MIGRLRHRVTIQEPVQTPNGSGGVVETWQDIAKQPQVFAAIQTLSSGEALRFHQVNGRATHRIHIRHRDDITPRMRLLRGSIVYNIVSVTDRDNAGRFLEVLAQTEG